MADKKEDLTGDANLTARWEKILEQQRQEEAKIAERIRFAQDLQSKWKQIQDNAKKRFDAFAVEHVEFNVGGESLTIRKDCLARTPLSLLYCLISTDIWQPDDNGEYFFDREAAYFEVVAEFTRDGRRRGKDLDQALLDKEFEFFGLNDINVPEEPGPLSLGAPPKASDALHCQDRFEALFNSNKQMVEIYRSTFAGAVMKWEAKIKHWRALEDRIGLLAAQAKSKVTFKEGGKLSTAVSGRWALGKDGSHFLDHNPRLFAIVLRYLRLGSWNTATLSNDDTDDLVALAKELSLAEELLPSAPGLELLPLAKWFLGKKLGLLYQASRDGWAAASFHSCCDNKGPTFVVCTSSSGAVFGGYASVSWVSAPEGYLQGPGSWLFCLKDSQPLQIASKGGNELYGHPSMGPALIRVLTLLIIPTKTPAIRNW